jgi:tetratricopeptide (TPR) repeat protein
MSQLRLEARDFTGPLQWRWLLSDATGASLADHPVDLAGEPGEFAAFKDLYRYLRWNAAPDRRASSEAEIVARVGVWAAQDVLGRAVCDAIVAEAPATVQVVVPEHAGFVLSWPLELAHAGGQPLAARGDVTLIYNLAPDLTGRSMAGQPRAAAERGLRMLAMFSLPTATSVLALRRERFELVRLVRRIAARQQRWVELTVVQYGATRERLAAVAEAGDGWDVLHLSGHGGRGQFLLETADGSPDPIDTSKLVELLAPLRRRVRLAVVSACESAAATTAETLRWVGLEEQAQQFDQQAEADAGAPVADGGAEPVMTGVARAVADKLGCAVVAMRYPVVDDFAIAFAEELYERLLGVRDTQPGSRGQPLDVALARAVARAAGPEPSPARPVLSLATPVLMGGSAAGLVLEVPRGQPELDPTAVRMHEFPPEPKRFVGRTEAMAKASAALAPGSEQAGVLLHGMAGSGKTACALELAYRHQDSFAAAFWQAPLTNDEFGGALASLAVGLEKQLDQFGFAMSSEIATVESLARFAPRLRQLLEDKGILLVLDNLETLLTPAGAWRDPRWGTLMAALTGHDGESRVILTSRIPPAGLGSRVLVLSVHALDLAESVALARELPGLRGLLHADAGPERDLDETTVAADRRLVRRMLHVVQGHPKLMELAAAAAEAGPARLTAQLDAAEAATVGHALDAFFRDGVSALDADKFLDALTAWTATTLDQLPSPARLMAQFMACLEEGDRQSSIIDATWASLWHRLNQPGAPPGHAPLLPALTAAALIQPIPLHGADPDRTALTGYRMHPGIGQAIRSTAPDVQAATDTELAAVLAQVSEQALQQQDGGNGQLIVQAGLAAIPYLRRLEDWNTAQVLLDRVITMDTAPTTVQAALPALRTIADTLQTPEAFFVLAHALASVDPTEAETLLRRALAQAASDEDFRIAYAAADWLSELLKDAGRLREALDFADQAIEYDLKAGRGPWNQLNAQAQWLKVFGLMGHHRHVLEQIMALREYMDKLPVTTANNETIDTWYVRENVLDIGRLTAQATGEWQMAVDLNAALLAIRRARGATAYEIIRRSYWDATPLIELGRLDDAERILRECQKAYEDESYVAGLQQVLTVRATLENRRGRPRQALELQRTAIRFAYVQSEIRDIAINHNQLANRLATNRSDPAARRAHRLAAALLFELTGMTSDLAVTNTMLASELRRDGGREDLPNTVDEVIRVTEQTEGVHLNRLLTSRQSDRKAVGDSLARILRTAADTGPEKDPSARDLLQRSEPAIVLMMQVTLGAAEFRFFLDALPKDEDAAVFSAVLRRIVGGERDESMPQGLNSFYGPIVGEILTRLAELSDAQHATVLDSVRCWKPTIALVFAAARGAAAFRSFLDELPKDEDAAVFSAVLRRIVSGERDRSMLQGLNSSYAPIVGEILTRLAELLDAQHDIIQHNLQRWEREIEATVAAVSGNPEAVAWLAPVLDRLAQDQQQAELAAVLRRIIDGEREDSLLQGLDPVHAAVTGQILARLSQSTDTPAQEDP